MLSYLFIFTIWCYVANAATRLKNMRGGLRPYNATVGRFNEYKLQVWFDNDCVTNEDEAIAQYDAIIEELGHCLMKDTNHSKHIFHRKKQARFHGYFALKSKECIDELDIIYTDYCMDKFDYESISELRDRLEYNDDYWCTDDNAPYYDDYVYYVSSSNYYFYNYWNLAAMDDLSFDFNFNRLTYNYLSNTPNVDIYIMDSGVLSTHVEFNDPDGYINFERLNDNVDDSDVTNDHGTHVAAIAGGYTAGIADYKGYGTLYDVLTCWYDGDGCSGQAIDEGFQYIIDKLEENYESETDRRRGVINMSWGGTYDEDKMADYNDIFEEITELGGIMVAATTNTQTEWNEPCNTNSWNNDGPANAEYCIAVGRYAWNMAYYTSGYGECIDIYGPGYSITSASLDCDDCYEEKSGTSMATPAVAGMIATLLLIDDSLTYDDITSILSDSDALSTLSSCPGDTCNALTIRCDGFEDLIDKYSSSTRSDNTDTSDDDGNASSNNNNSNENSNDLGWLFLILIGIGIACVIVFAIWFLIDKCVCFGTPFAKSGSSSKNNGQTLLPN